MKMEMNALCKISVIIPVYNVEAYLEDCLRSVQQQDFEDVEMICVDDGSTDGSRAILEQFAIQDPRIKILGDGINHGQATARNRAMECAQGEYLLFLDADDMLPTGTLSKLFAIASRDRLDVLMFDYERFYEAGFEKDRVQFPARARYCFPGIGTGAEMLAQMVLHDDADFTAWTALWRRRMLEVHQQMFHDGILYEDVPFAMQAMLFARRASFLPEVCYLYRRRGGSTMTTPPTRKNLLGDLVGTADIARFILRHGEELPDGSIRTLCRMLLRMQAATHHLMDRLGCDDSCKKLEHPAEEMVYHLALQNGKHYVKGFLTQAEQERLRKERDIILYGVGSVGLEALAILEEYGIRNYHLAVTKKNGTGGTGLVQLVHELQEYRDLKDCALVILTVGARFRDKMETHARNLGFQRIVRYYELM